LRDFEQRKRDILDRVDLVELVSEQVQLKRSGRRMVGLCPFHSEKTPSFTVSPDLGIFKCFGCGKGGDVFSFVQFRENVSFGEAIAILADRAGVTIERAASDSKDGVSRADVGRVCAWGERFFRRQLLDDRLGRSARDYLRERGFTEATLEAFGVGLAVDQPGVLTRAAADAGFSTALLIEADLLRADESGRTYDTFRNRIMFPIRDTMKRIVGFGGRTLVDDRAKYLNTRQNVLFDKGRTVYGIDVARHVISDRGRAVVVEGYTDCLAMHQSGYAETVATLGTALTEAHVDLLRRYADQIVFLFDSDDAGAAAADRAITVALPRSVGVKLARITDGKDPGELLLQSDPAVFGDVLKNAVDALEFKWLETRARFEGDSSDAHRREAVLDFLRVVGEAASHQAMDVIQRGLLVNQAAHLLSMDRAEVDRLMRKLERRPRRARTAAIVPTVEGRTVSAERSAWARVLEVVLNEPGLWGDVVSRLAIDRIPDDRDRRIAAMIEPVGSGEGYRLADVLARCDDPVDAERVCALARIGAERGNYKSTLNEGVRRLERLERARGVEDCRARFLGRVDAPAASALVKEDAERICGSAKAHKHFAPRRLIRGIAATPAPESDGV